MNVGASANDLGLMIVLLLGVLGIPLMLGFIGRIIGLVLGMRSATFAVVFMLVGVGVLLVGGAFYIDTAARPVQGLVTGKEEDVRIRRQGDWRYSLVADVAYRLDGAPPAADDVANPMQAVARLRLNAAQYDALQAGEPVELRLLPVRQSVSIVRLASISPWDVVPWVWGGAGLAVVAGCWLLVRFVRSIPGCLVALVVVLVAAVGIPGAIVYRQWQAMERLDDRPLRARATITSIDRVVQIDPLPCERRCSKDLDTEFDVPQQYDIVQVSFVPAGGGAALIGVDAADAGSFSGTVGQQIDVAYAASAPRDIQLLGATHSHHWKNMLAFVGLLGTCFGVVIALLLLLGLLGRSRRRVPESWVG